MKNIILGLIPVCLLVLSSTAQAQDMNLEQVLESVLEHYPSLRTALYQIEKAQQNAIKVKSRLGWQLSGSGGISNDMSAFGSTVERINVNAALNRRLKSGEEIRLSGGLKRESSDSPGQVDPLNSSRLEVSMRKPLRRGAENLDYALNLELAQLGVDLATAEKNIIYDKLAAQLVDIYFNTAITLSRIENIKQALQRTERLGKFIKSRLSLGIAEDKDKLQVQAQLHLQQAQLKTLEMVWVSQLIALNRLMGRPWDAPLGISDFQVKPDVYSFEQQFKQARAFSRSLSQIETRLESIRKEIKLRHDERKDIIDLFFYLGNQTVEGSSVFGEQNTSEVVGGVELQYQSAMDKSGLDASIHQARLELGLLQQTRLQILQDLNYDTAAIVARIDALGATVSAYRLSVDSENKKLRDAHKRYRKGRIDIDRLIQFENQLADVELNMALQRLELVRNVKKLDLLTGRIWQKVQLPLQALDMGQDGE